MAYYLSWDCFEFHEDQKYAAMPRKRNTFNWLGFVESGINLPRIYPSNMAIHGQQFTRIAMPAINGRCVYCVPPLACSAALGSRVGIFLNHDTPCYLQYGR